MSGEGNRSIEIVPTREQVIAKRIVAVGVALFFIMIGGMELVPEEKVPEGAWLIGAGLIILGANAARRLYGIKMVGLTIFLGILALILGISDFLGYDLPFFPILLILVGLSIILKVLRSQDHG